MFRMICFEAYVLQTLFAYVGEPKKVVAGCLYKYVLRMNLLTKYVPPKSMNAVFAATAQFILRGYFPARPKSQADG